MTAPRLIATDLDGTVLRRDGTLSPRTVRALRAASEAGARVVVVTARPPRHVDRLAAAGGLTGAAVCGNGAVVYDLATRRTVGVRALAVEVAREVAAALAAALPGIGFAVEAGHHLRYEPGFGLRFGDEAAEVAVARPADLWSSGAPITKLLAWSARLPVEVLLETAERTAAGLAQYTHSGGKGLLEISAAGVTKAATLAAWCAAHGIAAHEVVAFGDMPNDLAVLQWAGSGYAMANAHPSVLAAVASHTLSNEEDGVAAVLERLYG